ncbi:hypothetical protein SCHPADRAFT_515310 [Schizopora paradoxa]|uniref:Uncharacterized protein n=1 Tax=Schizopora paradoxa TaxID=27342 RepID=A0A0H2S0J2_9AGAM|nr:hypothetical protein SCHPADRAFT_515310 [Schizopora paradoxa]
MDNSPRHDASSSLGANTKSALNETPPADDSADDPLSSTPFLDELREDDTSTMYTYFSTWSTNYTVSNLPGPGRLLGNVYSRAGFALERKLGKWLNREKIRQYNEAVTILQSGNSVGDMLRSEDPKDNERGCEILLACASSYDVKIQHEAFQEIVSNLVSRLSKSLPAFGRVFKRRNEISDVSTLSWKRSGVEYSLEWMASYKLASRCLSSQQSPVFEEAAHFDGAEHKSLDFCHFEGLLQSCGDTIDLLLALYFIDLYGKEREASMAMC